MTGKRCLENKVESHNSTISQPVAYGKEASTKRKMARGQNKDTHISDANASVFAQQE